MPKAGDKPLKLSTFRATETAQGSWVPKQGSFFKGLVPLLSQKASPSVLAAFTLQFAARLYLEAVLLRHELLSFALVRGLQESTGRLGSEKTSRCSVVVLRQVEVCYLHTDLIAHYVLELQNGRTEQKGTKM